MTIHNYTQNGFLILEKFLDDSTCDALKARAEEMIAEFEPDDVKTIFSSKDSKHALDQYFLDSGDKIRFFFEAGAFDSQGRLTVDKQFSINKIGHALHDIDPIFSAMSRRIENINLLAELGVSQPRIIQSMYICKQPHIGGEVTCHQDSTYLFTEKKSVVGLWFALEDATKDNGCLWAIPGGHQGRLKTRFRRNGNQCYTDIYDDTPWELDKLVPLEVPKGTVIALHGKLPHMSHENKSNKSRHAYAIHCIAGDDVFAEDNWLIL